MCNHAEELTNTGSRTAFALSHPLHPENDKSFVTCRYLLLIWLQPVRLAWQLGPVNDANFRTLIGQHTHAHIQRGAHTRTHTLILFLLYVFLYLAKPLDVFCIRFSCKWKENAGQKLEGIWPISNVKFPGNCSTEKIKPTVLIKKHNAFS